MVARATEFCTGRVACATSQIARAGVGLLVRVACATSQIARAGVGLLVQRKWLHVQNQTTFLEVRPVARAEYVQFWSHRSLNISRQECMYICVYVCMYVSMYVCMYV